jgi:alpha-1,4-digalacturonate transport system substrate-binding protein
MSIRLSFAALALVAGAALAAPRAADAADIRITCYSDGNECEATQEMSVRFMKENPDINVIIDKVPYSAILQSLPVQLAAGNGPDIARVTSFGPIMQYFLDLSPYLKDTAYWEASYGKVLAWLRRDANDKGIYGLPTQLTVTGAIVDKSLFEQAKVPLPGPTATWDDWAAAVKKVATATKTPFGMAWDRSGHRFAGPAISHGAKYFAPDGSPAVIDDGFKAMASRFVGWNLDGTVDKDVWVASGSGYRDAFDEFANGKIVLYLSGSWQLTRLQKQIGDGFDWTVVGDPCGPAACSGMPGGATFVAFKQTKNPKEVARFLDWFAAEPNYAELMSKTSNIPAHQGLQASGAVKYDMTPAGKAAMQAFVTAATKLSPVAYQLQGYKFNGSIFNPTVDRISQAIAGQITLDQAYERITADIANALATAKK